MTMPKGYGPATENDPRLKTSDGVTIVDGGRYYNYYDMEWVVVEFGDSMSLSPSGKYWDGWLTVYGDNSNGDESQGPRRYTLNGERMAAEKPAWIKEG